MNALRIAGRAILVGVVLVLAQTIAGLLVPAKVAAAPAAGWWLLSTFITAVTLTVVGVRARWSGWRRAAAMALIPCAIQLANLAEAAFFLKNPNLAAGRLMLSTVIAYLLAVPGLVLAMAGARPTDAQLGAGPALPTRGVVWRFVVCDVSYLCVYFVAGIIIITAFPYVVAFYKAQGGTPSGGQVAAMQLLVRGPVFVVLCVLLARMVRLPRAAGALAVGFAFTLLSGVAPLLLPNPFFPDAVRWVHFGEVGSSNLVFGFIVGWLWSRPRAVGRARGVGEPAAVTA